MAQAIGELRPPGLALDDQGRILFVPIAETGEEYAARLSGEECDRLITRFERWPEADLVLSEVGLQLLGLTEVHMKALAWRAVGQLLAGVE